MNKKLSFRILHGGELKFKTPKYRGGQSV